MAIAISVSSLQAAQAENLNSVVSGAVLTNPQVQTAMNARNAIFEEVRQAKGGFLPQIDIGAGYGYERTRNTSTRAAQAPTGGDGDVELNRREANVSLNQMLFDGFQTSSEVDRQQARLASSNHRLREVAEEAALETSRVYLEVLKREELLVQAKESLKIHLDIFEQIRQRSDSGVGTLASIQQAEGRLALAEVNVLSAENNLLDAQTNYQRVTGIAVTEDLEEPYIEDGLIPASFEQAFQRTRENHPTLKLAQADVEAAVAQYETARSLMFPTLNLEVDRTWNTDIDGVEGRNEDLTAMIRMRYNLYNGGSDKARIRQTRHQINEAKSIQSDADRQARQSLELSWSAYDILGRQIQFLEQHVVSTERTRNSYQKQFDIGQRSLLDLLDTENEVFSAKNSYTEARYDLLLAQYRVLSGTGELLDSLAINVSPLAETGFGQAVIQASPSLMERVRSLNPFGSEEAAQPVEN